MNIIVTITVGLNVLQNASKCTISKEKIQKFLEPLQTTFLATGLVGGVNIGGGAA